MHLFTVGFGTAVAMWGVGYVLRLPPAVAPSWLVLAAMVLCLAVGGVVVGRHATSGIGGGAAAGGITGLVNLLIVGSLVGGDAPNAIAPTALLWIPGSVAFSMAVAAAGAAIGSRRPARMFALDQWLTGFVLVAVLATLMVVIAGGLVTSQEAGLAVTDWPNSQEYLMFLYPLSRMAGGVYYEHAHRLYGSLVGVTMIVLAVTLVLADRRRWVRAVAVAALLMVIGQGVMGGLRVDRSLSFSADPTVTVPDLTLAVVHGIFGQIVLVTVAVLWAASTRAWRQPDPSPPPAASVATDQVLSGTLALLVLLQLVLGAIFRHTNTGEGLSFTALAHITLAAVLVVPMSMVALRMWAIHRDQPVLRRLGAILLAAFGLQLVLGVTALVVVLASGPGPQSIEVVVTTAHQANGALLFVVVTQVVAWTRRLLVSAAVPAPIPS
jgi:cytochrome c oxidase assembly protein subunit 15